MPIEYNSQGLIVQNLSEILSEREERLKPIFGDDFYISGESAVANLQSSDADREYSIQQLLLYIANQLDPKQAEGIFLDFICALNNIYRYSATKTIIPITINGTPGTTKNVGELVIVDNSTNEYFTNDTAIVLDINGSMNTTFKATNFGPISVLSTATFSLKTPSMGISSVTYNTDGIFKIGRNTETDDELRLRREEVLEKTATSTLNSIKSSLLELADIESVNVYENDTSSTQDGMPAKSFEVVVLGGNNNEIATTILSKKPVGIQAYGTTVIPIVEDLTTINIGFTRPTEIASDLRATFTASNVLTEDELAILKNELIEKFNKEFTVGEDVYVYQLYSVLNNHPEIINVSVFQVKAHTSDTWSDSISIANRQIARLSASNITLTQSI